MQLNNNGNAAAPAGIVLPRCIIMKILSKISALLAAGAIMANTVWAVGEQPIAETQPELDIAAPSALLIHTSGKVIYARNEHDRRAPASVTKIMTLLL